MYNVIKNQWVSFSAYDARYKYIVHVWPFDQAVDELP